MRVFICFCLLLFSIIVYGQESIHISGFVRDSVSGEVLSGAFVSIHNEYAVTNSYGFYSISIPKETVEMTVSFIGYTDYYERFSANASVQKNILLHKSSVLLQTAHIRADHSKQYLEYKHIPIQQIARTTSMFGEADVIKYLQIQPGVKNTSEGSSGMYVRGGNRDQNLIYIDEASLYSVSHMYGFVSVCNPLTLQDVKFYNTFIPAEYGGRISSVLDMKLKEGNKKSWISTLQLSTLTINGTIEGPIKKDTSSVFFAVRYGLLDKILKDLSIPSFYDIIGKTNYNINSKNSLYASFYISNDNKKIKEIGTANSQINNLGSLRWTHTPSSRIFISNSVIYNVYESISTQDSAYLFGNKKPQKITWKTGVTDISLKHKTQFFASKKHTFIFGAHSILHRFIPGTSSIPEQSVSHIQVSENAVFLQDNIAISPECKLQAGIRYNVYANFGKAFYYKYYNNYTSYEKIQTNQGVWNSFQSIEPRVRLSYNIKNIELSTAYSKTSQAMQILSNNTLSYTNMETWFPYSKNMLPIISNNYSLGILYNTSMFSFIHEAYIKNIKNQIDYIDHAQLIGNVFVESQIRSGTAQAYGFETTIIKKNGKNTGQLSYCYSRIFYTIQGITRDLKYIAPHDIPHDIKFQFTHQFNKQFSFASNWMFSSGKAATVPIGVYKNNITDYNSYNSNEIVYSERNEFRFPHYHRLDISASYAFKERKNSSHALTGSISNVYGRKNPLFFDLQSTQADYVTMYYSFRYLVSCSYKITIKH
jgi:hypothetical protein